MLKGYSLALNWLWLQIRFLKLDTQRRQRSCHWKWSLLDKARVFFRLKCLSRVNSLILWRGCEKSFPFQCRRPVSAMRLPFPEWLASGLPPLPVPIAMFEALEGTCWSPYVSLVDFHGFMATCSSGDINIPPTFLPQPARLTFELLEVRVLPLGFDQLEGRRLLGCITNHRKNHHGYIFYNDVHIFVTHHSSPCMRRLWSCCQSTTTIVYIGPVRTPKGECRRVLQRKIRGRWVAKIETNQMNCGHPDLDYSWLRFDRLILHPTTLKPSNLPEIMKIWGIWRYSWKKTIVLPKLWWFRYQEKHIRGFIRD